MDHMTEPGSDKRSFLNSALQRLTSWRQYLPFGTRQRAPRFEAGEARRLMRDCLEGIGGEIAARSRAAELGYLYLNLERAEKLQFLRLLTTDFDVDREALSQAAERYLDEPSVASYAGLQLATQPPRVEIIKRLNSLPDGFKFLVDLRADLISLLPDEPSLASLDQDLQRLFEGWFDVGLLTFARITWDSPASLLERLVAYEAVHQIRSWHDLKNRLDVDRRCYAFFHPKMSGDPLIFVEVALTSGIPGRIQALLDEDAPAEDATAADTAVFYSISNTQRGLRGISFGSFLLKRVMEDLAVQMPQLRRFVTLSPIPGFRAWLQRVYEENSDAIFRPDEWERIVAVLDERGGSTTIRDLIASPDWADDPELAEALREPLLDLCAYYLLVERRAAKPLDPVARFHVTNGASVERLSFLADTSEAAMRQSLGLMVNYLYSPDELEKNHERLFRKGEVAAAGDVRKRAVQAASRGIGQEVRAVRPGA